MTENDQPVTGLPCVVQVGFAGPRNLFDDEPRDDSQRQEWEQAVGVHLNRALDELREHAGLSEHHFLCGISQIAIGADMIFARTLTQRREPHRIFLTQPTDQYLSAMGSRGPDFSPSQQETARDLLAATNIIQVRVVSSSSERYDRFRDVNAEILRVSDVIVSIVKVDAESKAGGTSELVERAKAIGKPVLEIRLSIRNGQPVMENQWHGTSEAAFGTPELPKILEVLKLPADAGPIPSSDQFTEPLKRMTSLQSRRRQRLFVRMALLIIAAHIVATLLATLALALHEHHADPVVLIAAAETEMAPEAEPEHPSDSSESAHDRKGHSEHASLSDWVPWLLGIELLALVVGFSMHFILHHSRAAQLWANARVFAELARSIQAIQPRHLYLEHVFRLALPYRFRNLLRTLNVLYLRSTYANRDQDWQEHRDHYEKSRLDDQIRFYQRSLDKDQPMLSRLSLMFTACTFIAIVATGIKLYLVIICASTPVPLAWWPQLFGVLAIIMPVLAVAALSWSAALDYQARVETFSETLKFLQRRKKLVATCTTPDELDRLIVETETVLLGEVTSWFSRRANTNPS